MGEKRDDIALQLGRIGRMERECDEADRQLQEAAEHRLGVVNARLEALRTIAAAMEAAQKRGRIVLEYSVGDFCLTGNPSVGFEVADPSLPLRRCDLIGNPFDNSLSPAQRQSVDFANFVATLKRRTGGAISVEVTNAGRRGVVEYPEQTEGMTAGAWNTVAAQNNRVDIRVVPAG